MAGYAGEALATREAAYYVSARVHVVVVCDKGCRSKLLEPSSTLATMSRSLTATQIIAQGDYLNNDFDSNTLTVSQLLGVLTHHQIRYPTPYTKAKLVQTFLDEIKPKVAKLRKERLKRENSLASDDGITDGLTGQPLNADTKVANFCP